MNRSFPLLEAGAQPCGSRCNRKARRTNDVVLAASLDGVVKAFRASDGAELWSYATANKFTDVNGTPGNGGTIDSVPTVPGGTDPLVNSGHAEFGGPNKFQAGTGNALFVFRLPGN